MFAPICAALALIVAAPAAAPRRAAPRATAPKSRAREKDAPRRAQPAPASGLARAQAQLAQLKRDPVKRRYRHHWERAIAALVQAARGRERGPAFLDAARARYALYRFSQVESDRDDALRLAVRARRAGAREATAFAAAVRREMGEDEPRNTARPAERSRPPAVAPREAAAPEDAAPSSDPVLERAIAAAMAVTEKGPTPPKAEPAHVSEVRSWSAPDYTRVAIYLSRPVAFTKEELAAAEDRPRRLALDLTPALVGRDLAHVVGSGNVERVRATQRDPETVRVSVDLAGTDRYDVFSLDDPPRLIVDVGVREARREAQVAALQPGPHGSEASDSAEPKQEPQQEGQPKPHEEPEVAPKPDVRAEVRAEAKAAEPRPEAKPAPSPEPRAPGGGELAEAGPIRRIVIDAGHGGHDTGAIGPTKVREKDVTLAMARRLAARLQRKGFEVVLTREDDAFVPLEERTAIANARRGDLFVSIHANAHPRRDRRGVETYVLNLSDDRYARRLAARENGALGDEGEVPADVRRILSDLNAQSSGDSSRRLARAVQRQLCAGIRAGVGDVRDLGVKSALFYVLLGARMPAVLVETSFISNREEERRLRSGRFQEEVAASIARAVEDFAARQERIAALR